MTTLFNGRESLRVRGERVTFVLTLCSLPVTVVLLGLLLQHQVSWQEIVLLLLGAMIYVSFARGRLLGGGLRIHAGRHSPCLLDWLTNRLGAVRNFCRRLLAQLMRCAFNLALPNAGKSIAARSAMIAMTTSNSMRVKPAIHERTTSAALHAPQVCALFGPGASDRSGLTPVQRVKFFSRGRQLYCHRAS